MYDVANEFNACRPSHCSSLPAQLSVQNSVWVKADIQKGLRNASYCAFMDRCPSFLVKGEVGLVDV